MALETIAFLVLIGAVFGFAAGFTCFFMLDHESAEQADPTDETNEDEHEHHHC